MSLSADDYLENPEPGRGARSAARSWLHTDAPTLSLNGDWRFRLLAAAPGSIVGDRALPAGESALDVAAIDYDDSSWGSIPVPAHWVLAGDGEHGRPIYTNVQFPFPVDPPFVPDENPTGDYRRRFMLDAAYSAADRILLRFDGVESTYRVWLNGSEVGVGKGSRLAQEFDVTPFAVEGENVLVVRVHQWSAASYIEDQDQWWLPGIFRDVSVQARPAGGIDDVWIRPAFDHATGEGSFEVEVAASDTAFPVTVSIDELGVEQTFADRAAIAPVAVGAVDPWTAETPRLYEVRVASGTETITQRTGFRTVEIVGDRFLVNGRRVVFHGVNRHETHPERGRVFDEQWARDDLAMMKRFNVNAIRTSHYPPHPRVLDLADELGFWVIDECDLETHGFEAQGDLVEDRHQGHPTVSGWARNPSDDPAWREAYLDRIERTVERDKNHPSIVIWSLGNESGTGANLAAMAGWVHDRDPGRPVHYEGDYAGAYTDVYSRMYAPIAEVTSIGTDGSMGRILGIGASDGQRQRSKPFLLCEYVHAMGNGPGAIDQYEELVERFPRLHGGFVWEWRDHGLLSHTADGTPFYAYGGDFGEVVHDGNFVMDGMVLSDSTPSPGLWEWKTVVAPIRMTVGDDALTVRNLRHTASTTDLRFAWRLEHDGIVRGSGEIEVPEVPAGEEVSIPLPTLDVAADAETWVTVEAQLAEASAWADAGHVVAVTQSDLTSRRTGLAVTGMRPTGSGRPTTGRLAVGPAEFDDGVLVSLAGLAVDGPTPVFWRAPTDNDEGASFGSYEIAGTEVNDGHGAIAMPPRNGPFPPSSADDWRAAGLHRMTHRVLSVEAGDHHVTTRLRSAPATTSLCVLTDLTWFVDPRHPGAVVLHVQQAPSRGWLGVWPRIGLRLDLPGSIDRAFWFGTGPRESYPDSRHAALVGRYEAGIDELPVEYARPQETGHRSDLRELELSSGAEGALRVRTVADRLGRRPGFTLDRFTAEQRTVARHPFELGDSTGAHLYLDAAQHGLGSRACGPDVWPTAALTPGARGMTLVFEKP